MTGARSAPDVLSFRFNSEAQQLSRALSFQLCLFNRTEITAVCGEQRPHELFVVRRDGLCCAPAAVCPGDLDGTIIA